MSEDWQFCFSVKGLIAPEKGVQLNDILIRGIPPSHDASVYFKASTKNENERDKLRDELVDVLRNIAQVYGLMANTYVTVLSGSSIAKITAERPFGSKDLRGGLSLIPIFDEERRNKNIPVLEKTFMKYEAIKIIFQGKDKRFLKNAMDYYFRSLGDDLLEEKLIDLMISLESLFSKENDELGLRYSLRTAFLVSVGQEDQCPNIFRNVQTLYGKRSKVVHGNEVVNLSFKEISTFQEYVREAIKRLLHIEMTKQKFLELLDESVYDEKKRQLLNQLVKEAINKW